MRGAAAVAALLVPAATARDGDLGALPAMGWNTVRPVLP